MRKLRIANKDIDLEPLADVPEDLKFVERMARQHASTNEELKRFYLIGVVAARELKECCPKEFYDKKLLWTVRQAIEEEKAV